MPSFLKRFLSINPLTLTILVIVLGIGLYIPDSPIHISLLDTVELETIDIRFKIRGKRDPGPEVVLAVVDEKSLEEQGKWVWPREKIARLIRTLSDSGAAVVGLDIVFAEPDTNSTKTAVEDVEKAITAHNLDTPELMAELDVLKARGDNDRILAESIRDSKTKVVLGYFLQMSTEGLGHVTDAVFDQEIENAEGSRYKVVHYLDNEKDIKKVPATYMPQANIAQIADSTPFSGYFNMRPDSDGTVRWMPMVFRLSKDDNYLFSPLSIQVMHALSSDDPVLKVAGFGVVGLSVGRKNIPTNEAGSLLINYMGGPQTYPHISATDIIEGRIPPERFKDKIVLVGVTAIGVYDMRVTPFSEVYPGLEIHANVVDNMLRDDYLVKPNWGFFLDILAILVFGSILGVLLPRLSVVPGGLAAVSIFLVYLAFCQTLFSYYGYVINLVYPSLVVTTMYLAMTTYKYVTEERQKRFIKSAFSTYLAPKVVDKIVREGKGVELGGEERVITAFFSDVAGFTSISEKLSPHELVELLNEFLTEMTNIILSEQGTVDKYEGDAIIAFFGAPLDMPDHAEKACIACIKMQDKLDELREKFASEGKPSLHMRIGMSTGRAVVGNMGSAMRMDYTMMGDTVNTAARLEGVNKIYGTYTMISKATYLEASHAIATRELDAVNVVGKGEPITIYEILGLPGTVPSKQTEVNRHYSMGLAAYRKRQFDDAITHFGAALATNPDDGPSKTMFERSRAYKTNPPPPDWNGAYTMTSK